MVLLLENTIIDILLVGTTLLVLVFSYFHHAYKYWKKRNVPFLQPKFPLGNSPKLITKSITFGLENIKYYEEAKKRGLKFAGIYTITRPVLVVIDPDYIRDILTKGILPQRKRRSVINRVVLGGRHKMEESAV
ncbi:hypothetical protein NQ314_005094 [Rhamnusium bicolor]|uniref:Cytochrome P450 n=1 Tax=Rhamnusium bicolor TaxID=1586634 RepID=A0AAV8ZJP9_9CUCU|nr:hypothetical protein NQ314_005094 [Rhamnusium bicolor]